MPSQMVDLSASVNLPLHHKVQKLSSGTGSPGWCRKKGRKTVVVVVVVATKVSDKFMKHLNKNRPSPFPGWMSYEATKPAFSFFVL